MKPERIPFTALPDAKFLRVWKGNNIFGYSPTGRLLLLVCFARCPNPQAGREKASKTMQFAKKGKFITDLSQGSCRNQRSGAGSESQAPKLLTKFIGYA